KDTYDATGYVRLWHDTDADVIGLVDADLLFVGDFDEIVLEAYEKQCVLGCIAHMTPFREAEMAELSSEECWGRIFAAAGLPMPELNWQYSAWGYMDNNPKQRTCPAYFNYGVILMPRNLLKQMAESYVTEIRHVERVFDSIFKSQIANTLVFARYDMPCVALSINYNHPLYLPEHLMREINPDAKGRNSAEDIKIFHYLASGEINKRHFATVDTVTALFQRQDLSPLGQVFRRCLQELHDKIAANYPTSATVFNPLKGITSTEIIICGGRRTGTTLLAAILSSDVRTNPLAAEAQIVTRIVETYRWGRKNFAAMIAGSFFDSEKQFARFYQDLLNRFVREVSARVSPGGVLILKNPEFSLVLMELLSLFKRALFLVTIRDPRDYVASEIEVERRRLADQGRDPDKVDRDIAKFAQRYMDYLRQHIKLINNGQLPERLHVIYYEDMVLKSEQTLHRLSMLTGLQLQFNPAEPWGRVSEYAGLDTTPSRSDLYGKPIQTSQVGRYRHDLSADEIRVVEKICAQMMHCFGYKPDISNH
ncbi:sulfotransferase family protein, partial [Methylocucumis oryzae]